MSLHLILLLAIFHNKDGISGTLGNLYTQPYVDNNSSKSFIFFYFDSHKIHLCDYYFQRKYNLTLQ